MNRKIIQKEAHRRINLRLTFLLFLTVSFFLLGAFSLFVYAGNDSNRTSYLETNSGKTGYAIQEENKLKIYSNNIFFSGLFVSIFGAFIINMIVLIHFRKMLRSVWDEDKIIGGRVESLENSKNDELKELVMTRNMLLMKMTNNKKNKNAV